MTKRIFWFTQGTFSHAPTRYRAYVYASKLSMLGVHAHYYQSNHYSYSQAKKHIGPGIEKRIKTRLLSKLLTEMLCELGRYLFFGIYLFQRIAKNLVPFLLSKKIIFLRCFPHIVNRIILRILSKDLYFDFDDALFLVRPSQKQGAPMAEGGTDPEMAAKMAGFIRRCKGVFVSNEYLGQWARQYNPRVFTVPTSVEVDDRLLCDYPAEEIVLGWIGAPENQKYLLEIIGAVTAVFDEFPGISLHIVTDKHWDFGGDRITYIPWQLETYTAEIRRFHIGLAPLPENPWTKGKMQFKAVQYAAQGVPVVGSPVGFNRDHWRHGENILFAASEAEYRQHLRTLIKSADLRRRMGLAGLETVKRHYNASVNAGLLLKYLET